MNNILNIIEGTPLLAFLQERLAARGHAISDATEFAINNEVEEGEPVIDADGEEWATHKLTGCQSWTFTFAGGATETVRFHRDELAAAVS